MSLPQILFSLYFAFIGAYLSIVLARVLKQNGTVLHKIDKSIGKMDEGFKIISSKMDEGFKIISSKMDEGFRKMSQQMAQQHHDVVELLKKGFGT